MSKIFYVLFENHENGLKLHKLLRENNLESTISPTPRSLSKCCGISLMIDSSQVDEVNNVINANDISILKIESVEMEINPNRDRYC
ncbi:DUF3343 domain-containing protein [Peptostreptococcus faecalis]|uniref:DUF3343 domain-containing protein n=1 Tax=Peptostreptococcus faecalis TaxID=2045015 RepID=UPI000C7C74C4|nr:DUF3343 domain-containing protein [Peptostreptococcus faecalis]